MRKLILQMQMSVDGFVGSASSMLDWQVWNWGPNWTWDRKLKRDFNATFARIDCILLSRPMAEEGYFSHWERTAREHPDDPDYDFARKIGAVRKVVFSRRLKRSRWKRTTIARQPLADAVQTLKNGNGGDLITFGGTGFAAALVAARLVDEFQLYVNPAVLGKGDSIFARTPGFALQTINATAYPCGIVVHRCAPRWKLDGAAATEAE